MQIERVQQASVQFEHLNGRTCLEPQAVFAYLLNPLYLLSARRRMERNWGVITEILVSVPQTR